jgi:hypothetical protein
MRKPLYLLPRQEVPAQKVINKNFSEEDYEEALRSLFEEAGITLSFIS